MLYVSPDNRISEPRKKKCQFAGSKKKKIWPNYTNLKN